MQELLLILAILLLVFGPSKLPKIARELGKLWYEFSNASSGAISSLTSTNNPPDQRVSRTLLDLAKKLDLSIEGKTDKQLTEEILAKVLNSKSENTKTAN